MKKFLLFVILAAFAVSYVFAGPVSYYGELKANGNKLVGSKTGADQPVQVRGVSFGWSNTEWESEQFFKDYVVNAMVDDWKAEVIRAPLGYSENGGYKTDASNKNRIKTVIDASIEKDVYVIIDWHSHSAQNETEAAKAYFKEMAQTYGDKDNVIFEIFNEPLQIEWSVIKAYSESIISTIREYSDNLILIGTPAWDQDVNKPVGNFLSDNNVAYVSHFYAGSHQLDSWTAGGWNTTTFKQAIEQVLNAGKPVFISEYGTVNADGNGGHNGAATDAWYSFLNQNKISFCAWHVNNKDEGSSYFKPSFTPTPTASYGNTSNMTTSGQYIFNKLNGWANETDEPWRATPTPISMPSIISSENAQAARYYTIQGKPLGVAKPTISGVYIQKTDNFARIISVR